MASMIAAPSGSLANPAPFDHDETEDAPKFRHGVPTSSIQPADLVLQKVAEPGARSQTQGSASTASTESSTESGFMAEQKQQRIDQDCSLSNEGNDDATDSTCVAHKLQVKYLRAEEQALIEKLFLKRMQPTSNVKSGTSTSVRPLSAPSPCSLLLITGPCGSGKSYLAKTCLQPLVQERNGLLVRGTFDKSQLYAPSPYSALTMALTEWTQLVVQQGIVNVQRVKQAIINGVGEDDAGLLQSMIPAVECILGTSAATNDTTGSSNEQTTNKKKCPNMNAICGANIKSKQSLQRFTSVLTNFLHSISSCESPLVLILDDLHYADPCSLDILACLVCNTPGMFLVGTCDDSSVLGKSYLASKLREIEDTSEVSLVHVQLGNLHEEQVNQLLRMTFTVNRASGVDETSDQDDSVKALAKLLMEQTDGNIFYVTAFLHWLVKSELLDRHGASATEPWTWDVDEIRLSLPSAQKMDVVDFLSGRFLEELPCDLKETLKVAACIGSHISGRLVEHAFGTSALPCLREARERGILLGDDEHGVYSFNHEYLQMAAYRLIPKADLALYHLEIGRRIWRHISPCGLHRLLFVILAQMQHGKHLITRDKERLAVANLCLSAGTVAARTSTFRTAAIYLEFGILMLEDRSWRDEYDLTLSLFKFAAEVQMCTANFERMDELVNAVLKNARRLLDKIPAYCTRIYALSVQGQGEQAILTGVDVLAGLGENFPGRLCGVQLHKLYCKVAKQLYGKSDEVILRMPTLIDEEKLASLQVLHLIFITALLSRPRFTPFIVLTMMDITLRNGLSAFSSLAFAYFGMVCLQYINDTKMAFRYGELSLALLDRFQAEEFIPRVHCAFYGCIYPRRKPLEDTLEHLWTAHLIGMRTGDHNAAFLCASLWMINAFESNVPLPAIERRMKKCRESMRSYRQTTQMAVVQPHLSTIDFLMGVAEDDGFDDTDNVLEPQNNVTTEFNIPFTRLQRSFFFNDFENTTSIQIALTRKTHLIPPSFKIIAITFMAGLAALAEAGRGVKARKNKRFARKVLVKFKSMYTLNSPQNCLGMQFLLEAELAALSKNDDKARLSFAAAIAMAEANQLLYLRGLVYERAGRHLFALGERKEAFNLFVKAIEAYSHWGASRKVQMLELQLELDYKISRPCTYLSASSPDHPDYGRTTSFDI
ncbi:hypothetical protein MPSEU_000918600 [Mayamaea pseudoterrestris]|nr:hypothetical protein MPSEU_000918600 [Mayamaea pseudoterrestris]